jgi:type I restriction-modification system DNA methylase subunit
LLRTATACPEKDLPATLQTFAEQLQNLIKRFEAEKQYHLSKQYSEAQARVDFITPLFRALGWDVENEAALPHHQREVIVERGESETTGRPDYSFRVGGLTKFFVEAKAPSEPLDAPRHILQAKGYAWNTKQVSFVILTDFEEFRFYDASIQPDERKPDEGLLLKLGQGDYLANVERLWEFSKERVAAASLDAMLPRDRRTQRLRIPVDAAFLDEMTGWREDLARNIFKNNHDLTAKQLNEVVQRLLDRIVFIRIAEDRHIIEKNQLRDAVEEWQARGGKFHIFDWLRPLFEKINDDFNGEIFKPNEALERTRVDSEALARIIERLYPPKSPYRFDVIGVELLGSIYERYLGKTIRPTAKTVRVEEKPEVRKAGGVYYTPQYIVDYIVKNTVGKVIGGKTPRQIEKVRILDPACGSGSFLIGAFQYLIDYHVRYLTEHPKEAHVHPLFPDLIPDGSGGHRLSVRMKAKILRNNLFGVDIDPQAVEITMMSLYLKALEGEGSLLPPKQSLLPELKYNIMCGNSLIGPGIYRQAALFADEERDRINAFDWGSESAGFGRIMKEGGFDCVIGNPPYIRIQAMKEWAPVEVEFYKKHYNAASSGNYDIYVVFIERGLSLLNGRGKLGFILPHKFFNARYGAPVRKLLSEGRNLSHVVHFGDQQVFDGGTTYTCLLFLEKRGSNRLQFERVSDLATWRATGSATSGRISAACVTGSEWNFSVGGSAGVLKKLKRMPVRLGAIAARMAQGIRTSANEVYVLDLLRGSEDIVVAYSTQLDEEVKLERKAISSFLQGREIKPYVVLPSGKVVIVPYQIRDGGARLMPRDALEEHLPRAWRYLCANRRHLEGREKGRFRGAGWYMYGRQQNIDLMLLPKVLVPDIADRACFALDERGEYAFTSGYGITFQASVKESPKYILGLLNSTLLDFYLKSVSTPLRGGFFRYFTQFIEQLPIRRVDFADASDRGRHDRMVALVERMLQLSKKKHSGKLAPSELDRVEREIAATDQEIDNLVYELYGITREERGIIEEETDPARVAKHQAGG